MLAELIESKLGPIKYDIINSWRGDRLVPAKRDDEDVWEDIKYHIRRRCEAEKTRINQDFDTDLEASFCVELSPIRLSLWNGYLDKYSVTSSLMRSES